MIRLFQLSGCFAAASFAAALLASSPSSAHIVVTPGCEAAEKHIDQGWETRSRRIFGRAGEVDIGSTIWRGTIVNGVDLGAFLEKSCFRRYDVEPEYSPYSWPLNGYPNWVTPMP